MNSMTQGAVDLSAASAQSFTASPFRVMGYKNAKFFFQVKGRPTPVSIAMARFRPPFIFQLAPVEYWQARFPTDDKRCPDGVRWKYVAQQLMRECFDYGEFVGMPKHLERMQEARA